MVSQVFVVAILMIVQGCLVALMGLMLEALAAFVQWAPDQFNQGQQEMSQVLMLVYAIMGAGLLAIGGLQIVAGYRNLQYRGRTMGIVALSVGLLPVFTCYCAPTAIGLAIYGLIIYLHNDSLRAFQLGEQGYRRDQIMAAFSAYAPRPGTPPPGNPPEPGSFGPS